MREIFSGGKNVFLIKRILVPGSRHKFIYAATAKTSPGNLLCYVLRTCFTRGWVSVYFITRFLKNIRKNQKPWKSTRALLIACHCQLNMKENKSSSKNLLWNNSFQITRESLQLICQFLTFNSQFNSFNP